MLFRPVTLFITLIIWLFPFVLNAEQNKTPLYVFGDSLFDNGMTLYNGIRGAGADNWPYGDTYFKKPAGRFSDGLLIPDFIAEYAGLPDLEPYLKPGVNDYTKGINFACAGACVLVKLRPNTVNLKRQMGYFEEMVGKLKLQVGEEEANKILSKAVYMFNIGGNDWVTLLQGAAKVHRFPPSESVKRQRLNHVLDDLTMHYKTVYKYGGRKFAFLNIGPMGCMPTVKYLLNVTEICSEEANNIAKMYNVAFIELIKKLQAELPGFTYSLYDFYNSLNLRVLNGTKYGFRETETACCGSGAYNGDFTCQKRSYTFSVCSNPNDYLWFDAGHPTHKAYQGFAQEFWSGGKDIVSPYNLQELFSASINSI